MFDDHVNNELKWNKSYCPSMVCNENLSMLLNLEIRSAVDGFDYFIKESNISNIKEYFESFINSDDFKTYIETINYVH